MSASVCAPPWFADTLAEILARRDLADEAMTRVMEHLVSGACGDVESTALLVALRMKGETASELAAAARVLRAHMILLETGRDDVLDTCGTGGDSAGTFNVSTAVAFVVAGCGVPVVKHGNRAISGRTGSADVLEALGVQLRPSPAWAQHCLGRTGLAFCFAPLFHPALKNVGEVRRRLGVRTLFNMLGPLVNPARTPYQLLGVGRPEWLDTMAGALARLGDTRRALLVSGHDGLDEVTLAAPTRVREVCGSQVRSWEWSPADFGLPTEGSAALHAGSAQQSAAIIRQVLDGRDGAALNLVLANAAAALVAAGRVISPREGVTLARDAIQSGRAANVLQGLIDAQ